MHRSTVLLLGTSILGMLSLAPAAAMQDRTVPFATPIDGLSIHAIGITGDVSAWDGRTWTPWQHFVKEDERDPLSLESNFILFPRSTSMIRLRGTPEQITLHPVRIAEAPAHFSLASMSLVRPRILSRSDWGADDNLLLRKGTAGSESSPATDTSGAIPSRVQDCVNAQKLYPDEFRISRTETTDGLGHTLLWPQQYSPSVRLIVVHHTAEIVSTDSRTGLERMRALYLYHAKSMGWGDVGYHYIIDETGQIYQGRAGGEYVVGGHAYCNNIGTIGIALMGNFDVEKPTQAQMQSLQWLIDTVSKEYNIDLTRSVFFHGKTIPPVVGHRDLLSTDCPGYYAYGVLDQVRSNVRAGNLDATVSFPPPPANASSSRSSAPSRLGPTPLPEGLSALGSTTLSGRPGGQVTFAVQYRAGAAGIDKGDVIATIGRSNPAIGVWVLKDNVYTRVRASLLSPDAAPARGIVSIRMKTQMPLSREVTTLRVGSVAFSLVPEGKVLPTVLPQNLPTPAASSSSISASYQPLNRITNPRPYVPITPSPASSTSASSSSLSGTIRIRLHDTSDGSSAITVTLNQAGVVGAASVGGGAMTLRAQDSSCVATVNGLDVASGVVRIDPQGGVSTISSWQKAQNRFRGVLECRVMNGTLVLIDELPMEQYIAGLSEEPDTEPHEKQRAFAVAARTYATYYLDPQHRKFPDMPYDGSDAPSEFQAFGGVAFETSNPQWLRAVRETAGQVLSVGGDVLRIPYFSSDDGRTRSPAEAGWTSFPHAEIFTSKPDPWCKGFALAGHGVGMSGCGARGQAYEGKTYDQILQYYYPGAMIQTLSE